MESIVCVRFFAIPQHEARADAMNLLSLRLPLLAVAVVNPAVKHRHPRHITAWPDGGVVSGP